MIDLSRAPLENDTWELYETRTDFSLANDLAATNSEKLKQLQIINPALTKTLGSDGRLQNVDTAVVAGLRIYARF